MLNVSTTRTVPELARRNGLLSAGSRNVPEEVPVAFSYGGSAHAVMMATPDDLEDFAIGFSLTEGIIASATEVERIDIVEEGSGIDVQITLATERHAELAARRRHMAGPVGCGLCGIESIEQAVRRVPSVVTHRLRLSAVEIAEAVGLLHDHQPLNRLTRAVHGAGFYSPGKGLVAMREDVGRHNALDKLAGAIAGQAIEGATGAVVVTSRLSVEMVQKAAMIGSPILIAISAPTALAIRTAETAGLTLVALARGEDFEIFTHADRLDAKG